MTRAAAGTESVSSASLRRALRAVAARARAQRALEAWVALFAVATAVLIAAGLMTKTGYSLPPLAWLAWGVLPFAGALAWCARPVAALPIARAIDRALATPDLVASAVQFAALAEAHRTAFMRACMAQAEAESARLVPARALSFTKPRALPALCAALLVLIVVPGEAALPPPAAALSAKSPASPAIDEDTKQAFAREAEALRAQPLDPEAQAVLDKLNQLLEALAAGELDRAEALMELRRLEERLASAVSVDPEALEAALEELSRALAGTPEAKPLEKALREDWPEAANELEKLAERVAKEDLKAGAQERLAQGLERAAAERASSKSRAAVDAAKRELDRLLRDREDPRAAEGESGEKEERLLKRKQRELDQLEREHAKHEAAERELERLQRELDAASKALKDKQRQSAAERLQDAASELERAAQQQASRSQAQKLAEQLAQLRAEIAQRGGQQRDGSAQEGGSGSAVPLSAQRFRRMAGGQSGGADGAGQQGQPNQPGQPGQPGGQQPGGQQAGTPGAGSDAQHKVARLAGSSEGPEGTDTALLEVPGKPSDASGEGSGAGLGGAPKDGPATAGSGQHVDTRVEGEKRGGPSRSEVIFESGQRGFASDGYAKVHGEYLRHAESVLERERVPGGYRYYVRRYFQLIRPREAQGAQP